MSSKQKLFLFVTLVALLALVGSVDTASAQCAMCRTALEQNGGKLVGGFNRAIAFLLVMPYLVFGSIALSWYWKRTRAARAAEMTASASVLLEETGT
jgi:hypothetical protein